MFRDELMALNAIYAEQVKTNDLLTQLLNRTPEVDIPQATGGGKVETKGSSRGNSRKGS